MDSNGSEVTIQLEDNTRGTLTMFIEQSPTDYFLKINETRIPAHYFTTNKYSEYVSKYFIQNRFILGMEGKHYTNKKHWKFISPILMICEKYFQWI